MRYAQVELLCPECGDKFLERPSRVALGHVLCCSRACGYARRKKTHPKKSLAERFWAKVDKSGDCWIWTGSRDRAGYGTIGIDGKTVGTHRVAWELTFGKIPAGLSVLHNCPEGNDLPCCVNPAHLFLGTQKDNVADCVKKGRRADGERHSSARLTEADVRAIRVALAQGVLRRIVAERYGVAMGTIQAIDEGRTWKHVT